MTFMNYEVLIVKSDRKTISIEIKPQKVIVRTPKHMKDQDIAAFINSKRSWIEKHISLLEQRQKSIQALEPYTEAQLKEIIEEAKKLISEKVSYYAKKMGVTYGKVTIRCQRTRWGSCSSKGNLNFNCLLAMFPNEVIDSVVVHELCHRKHMNHSTDFYKEMEKFFPQHKQCSKWLKENGSAYLNRLPK